MHDCMKGQSDVVLLLSKPAKTSNLISRFKTSLLFADTIALQLVQPNQYCHQFVVTKCTLVCGLVYLVYLTHCTW